MAQNPSRYGGNYNKPKGSGYSAKRPNTWVNSRLAAQNKKVVREMNAAHRSRKLIKQRLMALTAKVALMEMELASVMEVLLIPNTSGVERRLIADKLLTAAEAIQEQPEEE